MGNTKSKSKKRQTAFSGFAAVHESLSLLNISIENLSHSPPYVMYRYRDETRSPLRSRRHHYQPRSTNLSMSNTTSYNRNVLYRWDTTANDLTQIEHLQEQHAKPKSTKRHRTTKTKSTLSKDSTTMTTHSQLQREESNSKCVICLSNDSTHAMVSCGHLCTCLGCAEALFYVYDRKCPICRSPIEQFIKIFK